MANGMTQNVTAWNVSLQQRTATLRRRKADARHLAEIAAIVDPVLRIYWDSREDGAGYEVQQEVWMEALGGFGLEEVRAALVEWGATEKRKPKPADIRGKILAKHRAARAQEPEPEPERVNKERAAEIMAQVGFKPRRFGGGA